MDRRILSTIEYYKNRRWFTVHDQQFNKKIDTKYFKNSYVVGGITYIGDHYFAY